MDGQKKRQSFLDIGCGRGGDVLKVYHARVGNYVGLDLDYEGIYSATDGAISRFNYLKKNSLILVKLLMFRQMGVLNSMLSLKKKH